MKRRHFLVTVGGIVALAGCYAVAEQEGYIDDLRDGGGGPTTTTTPPSTAEPGDGAAGPGIDVRDTEFVPGTGEGADGRGRFCATVENVGDTPLAAVDLWVEYYDADGVPVDSASVDVHDLAVGEVWSACVTYPGSGERVADHTVGGSFLPADGVGAGAPDGVTVRGDRLVADDCSVAVEGSVRNAGGSPVDYVEVRAKFRDAEGAVVATGRATLVDLPGPGLASFRAEAPRDRDAPDPASVADYAVSLHGPWW